MRAPALLYGTACVPFRRKAAVGQHFDRNIPFEPLIPSSIDHTHTACADRFQQTVVTQRRPLSASGPDKEGMGESPLYRCGHHANDTAIATRASSIAWIVR